MPLDVRKTSTKSQRSESVSRKIRLTLLLASVFAHECAADDGCYQPKRSGCHRPKDCARPGEPESAPAPEGAFITGPPRGEVAGESNSLGLRLGTLRIPEINIPLPTVQLPSLVRYRRDAHMLTESSEAPYVESGVAEFGLSPRESAPAESAPVKPESTPFIDDKERCAPPCYQCPPESGYAPQPYPPVPRCPEGCVSFQDSGDPWQNELQSRLMARERQIAELEGRIQQLQRAVETMNTQSAPQAPEKEPARNLRSMEVNPWNSERSNVATANVDRELIELQARQIEQMQMQINRLAELQSSSAVRPNQSEPTTEMQSSTQEQPAVAEKPSTAKAKQNPLKGVLGKFSNSLSRR